MQSNVRKGIHKHTVVYNDINFFAYKIQPNQNNQSIRNPIVKPNSIHRRNRQRLLSYYPLEKNGTCNDDKRRSILKKDDDIHNDDDDKRQSILSLSLSSLRRFLCTYSYYFRSPSFLAYTKNSIVSNTHPEFLPAQQDTACRSFPKPALFYRYWW